ncbi:hypothetical protein BH10PSE17_BH10PSE17_36330 [soil metagenome]
MKQLHAAPLACRNCDSPLTGPFCSACGQAAHDGEPPRLTHFFHDLIHEVVHLDGKIVKTLKALFLQPGKLTEEYWAGRVVSWIRPIRLFLVMAAIHLLAATGVGPLNFVARLELADNGDHNVYIYNPAMEDRLKPPSHPVPEAERLAWLDRFEKTYNTIRYTAVLLFALASWLLYRRQQQYFVAHLIEGLHFYSFWYIAAVVAGLLAKLHPMLTLIGITSVIYLFFMLRRLYHQRWYWTVSKTAALFFATLMIEAILVAAAAGWVERAHS